MIDYINSLFEAFGAVATWANVYTLLHERELKGISIYSLIFFTSWGFWNLYYYPALGQTYSFFAGAALVAGNTIWILCYFVFYINKKFRH